MALTVLYGHQRPKHSSGKGCLHADLSLGTVSILRTALRKMWFLSVALRVISSYPAIPQQPIEANETHFHSQFLV